MFVLLSAVSKNGIVKSHQLCAFKTIPVMVWNYFKKERHTCKDCKANNYLVRIDIHLYWKNIISNAMLWKAKSGIKMLSNLQT